MANAEGIASIKIEVRRLKVRAAHRKSVCVTSSWIGLNAYPGAAAVLRRRLFSIATVPDALPVGVTIESRPMMHDGPATFAAKKSGTDHVSGAPLLNRRINSAAAAARKMNYHHCLSSEGRILTSPP